MEIRDLPIALDKDKVGTYPALAKAGGGYVWDEVLEYRVWCHPERGAEDLEDGSDYYYAFAKYGQALEFSNQNLGTEDPIALVLQREYIDEPEPGKFLHIKKERVTEWPVAFLSRPRRDADTIPIFMSADPSSNCLDVLRGLA